MIRQLFRPSRAVNVVVIAVCTALFVTIAGTATAAVLIGPKNIKKNAVRAKHIKKKAVGPKHIKNDAIKPRHIKQNAVRAKQVRPRSISFDHLNQSLQGLIYSGVEGPQGPKGDPGTANLRIFAGDTSQKTISPGQRDTVLTGCPEGTQPVGGAFDVDFDSDITIITAGAALKNNDRSQITSYMVRARNDGTTPATVFATPTCLTLGE